MRARRIKREEKEARAQGRQRATTPVKTAPPAERPPVQPDSFRKRSRAPRARARARAHLAPGAL